MNTQEVVATATTLSIASDLALHLMNYGVPRVWDLSTYTKAEGLQNVGTITGVATSATVSGIASEDLKATIDAIPEPYDRLIARSAVAASFIPAKVVAQLGVSFIHSFLIGSGGRDEWKAFVSKQVAPSLVLNSLVAFAIPYAFSD